MKSLNQGFAALAAAVLCAGVSQASTISIEFTGLNLSYDGSSITDDSADADPLTSVSIEQDDVPIVGSPFSSDITLDLDIPSVLDIAMDGDTVVSAAGGSLDLSLPGGDLLELTLDEVTVIYTKIAAGAQTLQFAFGGSIADIDAQMLPGGLIIGTPIQVSFSTQVTSIADDGVNLTSFKSRGTGEIEGAAIPEPTALALASLFGVVAAARRR